MVEMNNLYTEVREGNILRELFVLEMKEKLFLLSRIKQDGEKIYW